MTAPAAFRRELRAHNRHAMLLALGAFALALLAWNLAYFFFVLILLGLTTAVRGDFGAEIPAWIPGSAAALAVVVLVWGSVDMIRRQFNPVPDRPIVGWHLFGEFLLLPVRLTFGVMGNLGAIRRLDASALDRAWELLVAIHGAGRAQTHTLTLIEPDQIRLHRLLSTLQLLGYIDLHRGEREWFYAVRSPREPELHARLRDRNDGG